MRRFRPRLLFTLGLVVLSPAGLLARDLTFEDRVKAQEAIERVYYSHQIGATKPFEEAIPREMLEKKVRTYLKQSVVLEKFWRTNLTAGVLRAEMERMARGSKMPERLQELYMALGQDSFLFRETIVRATLADRLARGFFAHDQAIHAAAGGAAAALHEELVDGRIDPSAERANRNVMEFTSAPPGLHDLTPTVVLSPEEFEEKARGFPDGIGQVGPLVDERAAFVIQVLLQKRPGVLRVATYTVPRLSWDDWWAQEADGLDEESVRATAGDDGPAPLAPGRMTGEATASLACATENSWDNGSLDDAPDPLYLHTAVWTGSSMVVLGGGSTARYDPATDTWTKGSTTNAPISCCGGTAVWTGSQVLVWNYGYTRSGGRYDPVADTWSPISTVNAPSGRYFQSAVWTGSLMVVWGGYDGAYTTTGGRYDPLTDTWTPTSTLFAPAGRSGQVTVWTGSRMIVWSGGGSGPFLNSGGQYDPVTDRWSGTTTVGAPSPRHGARGVWSGTYMIVWGGDDREITGGRYDPVRDIWLPTSTIDVPGGRFGHTAVWTGDRMVVWGGQNGATPFRTGGRYDPITDTWTPTSLTNAPAARNQHSAVWTGSLMIVWGGSNFYNNLSTGGRYDPVSDTWTPTFSGSGPSARRGFTSLWTGNAMIVWGGDGGPYGSAVQDGDRYDPATDSWAPMSTVDAPAARTGHTAVWTGDRMVVWGGGPANLPSFFNSGGRYDPVSDSWTGMSDDNAPPARAGHTAVWSGTRMIVWGGYGGRFLGSGGLYDPLNDTWTSVSTIGAPSPRSEHSAVWTGNRMVVWGGSNGADLDSGGRYDPAADMWSPISATGAPSARRDQTGVWTGRRMIVWGGVTGSVYSTTYLGSGARYDPRADSWAPVSRTAAPSSRSGHSAVWTGARMLVWGGRGSGSDAGMTGAGYDPVSDTWAALSTTDAPSARSDHRAVWTGNAMLVWGGSGSGFLNSGGRYCACTGPVTTWYQDSDDDGFGDAGVSIQSCSPPAGHAAAAGDCDDDNPAIRPGAAERCNGVDDDCDGSIDEGLGLGLACTAPLDACHQVVGTNECLPDGSGIQCIGPVVPHDVTPPLIVCPSSVISECPAQPTLGPAMASDVCDPAPLIIGNGPTEFPLGTTTVTFTATDASGNASVCTASATMQDTQPPSLLVPMGYSVDATMPSGAVLAYPVSATDACSGPLTPACAPPPGGTFPINEVGQPTVVTCMASDEYGNSTTRSFTVHVKGAEEQLGDLERLVADLHLPRRSKDLERKLEEALEALGRDKPREACKQLEEFARQVRLEAGKKHPGITAVQATRLLNDATRIRAVLGCDSTRLVVDSKRGQGSVGSPSWTQAIVPPTMFFTRE